jgi:hypothetical protein
MSIIFMNIAALVKLNSYVKVGYGYPDLTPGISVILCRSISSNTAMYIKGKRDVHTIPSGY